MVLHSLEELVFTYSRVPIFKRINLVLILYMFHLRFCITLGFSAIIKVLKNLEHNEVNLVGFIFWFCYE